MLLLVVGFLYSQQCSTRKGLKSGVKGKKNADWTVVASKSRSRLVTNKYESPG